MSSRSNGVRYCVLSSGIRSCVIAVAHGLLRLHLLLRDARVAGLAEAPVHESCHLERVLGGPGEEDVELARLGGQAHKGAHV